LHGKHLIETALQTLYDNCRHRPATLLGPLGRDRAKRTLSRHRVGLEGRIGPATLAKGRGLQLEIVQGAAKNRLARSPVALAAAFACVLIALVVAAWPGAADSAPLGVVVLGKTTTTPPPSCPGKIVNNVEVVPCRVEGHVSGYQTKAGGVKQPYEVPYDGQIVAWSITLAKP